MADKKVQLKDKDGNDIYPVSTIPANAIVGTEVANISASDLSNLANLIKPIVLSQVYPIGSIYISVNNINPNTFIGGTWVSWGSGRVPVGVDTTGTDFDTVEKTGGEAAHTLTINEMPSHNHKSLCWGDNGTLYFGVNTGGNGWRGNWRIEYTGASSEDNFYTSYNGGSQAHNNLQPYITCYMWKRTA